MTAIDAVALRTGRWTAVCPLAAIPPDTSVTALVDGVQVAVFALSDGAVHCLDAHDPCSGANVLGRGIVGDVDGVDVVASPVHKQRFVLSTGRCLDADAAVATHPVRVVDGWVEVSLAGGTAG